MSHPTLTLCGQTIPALGMGCWAIGGAFWEGDNPLGWGKVDDSESINAIEAGIDCGIQLLDTADLYGAGHSEMLLGKALKNKRHKVLFATQWGFSFTPDNRQVIVTNAISYYHDQTPESGPFTGAEYLEIQSLLGEPAR